MYFVTLILALFQLAAFAVGANTRRDSACPTSSFRLRAYPGNFGYYVFLNSSTNLYTLTADKATTFVIQGTRLTSPLIGAPSASVFKNTTANGGYIVPAFDNSPNIILNATFDANCNVKLTGYAGGAILNTLYALSTNPPVLIIQPAKNPTPPSAMYVPALVPEKI